MNVFPTSLKAINESIDTLNLADYAQTRNYLNGSVSRLSPYLSRGVITLPYVLNRILTRTTLEEAKTFIYELCWREYFQRIWHVHGDKIFTDFNQVQHPVSHHEMIRSVYEASTGIDAIDREIQSLYATGYMHNHVRMYTASMVINMAKAHWANPAKWMYYHLLDGDLASNTLSWQWVAGTFSSKKYYCNQANINTYCGTNQTGTFLDQSYDHVMAMECPDELSETISPELITALPSPSELQLDYSKPLLLYNSYTLDPHWRQTEVVNRVLVLEPSHFRQFPVSGKVMDWILALAKEISGIQLYCGEIHDLPDVKHFPYIISKEHPTTRHYPGAKDTNAWMFPEVPDPAGSFTGFWKGCEKILLSLSPS
jgi:deoxyribodipyrimidine photo-lyase